MLKKNGCTGGPNTPSANNSSIWSCPNVGKLSFRFTTTSGNQLRALAFEIMQKQLKSVGIELVAGFGAGTLSSGRSSRQVTGTLHVHVVGEPAGQPRRTLGIYGCGGGQNYMN